MTSTSQCQLDSWISRGLKMWTTRLTWSCSLFRGRLCGRQEGRRKAGPTCFLNCAACGEHFPILMPKVPRRRRPCVFRTIFKLEEEVNNEVEVTLLEEDFAKALKQQILLWCNPGIWWGSCRANKRRRTSFCQRQRGMSIDFHETKNPKTFWEAVECWKYLEQF